MTTSNKPEVGKTDVKAPDNLPPGSVPNSVVSPVSNNAEPSKQDAPKAMDQGIQSPSDKPETVATSPAPHTDVPKSPVKPLPPDKTPEFQKFDGNHIPELSEEERKLVATQEKEPTNPDVLHGGKAVLTAKEEKQQDLHGKIVKILREFGNLESEIPLSHDYWHLLNEFRGLR